MTGDEITLTMRDATGRETSIAITQFTAADGTTSIGTGGGNIQGPAGRLGRILPRALATAGVFAIRAADDAPLPVLPSPFAVVDRFGLRIDGADFKRLESLTLTESQGRVAAASALSSPFTSSATLTVPADFLLTASLRFTAAAVDRDGTRHSTTGATVVVAGSPDTAPVETGFGSDFPTVFLTAPRQAIPSQIVEASAVSAGRAGRS